MAAGSAKKLVLVPDALPAQCRLETQILGKGILVRALGRKNARQIPDALWSSADAVLLWDLFQMDAAAIARLKRCRVIVRYGAGFDNVNLQAAGAAGIPVCNVPDYGTNDVADHALMLTLALCRRLLPYHDQILKGAWTRENMTGHLRPKGATFGIIGLGRIGTAVALRAKAFGFNVVFTDPFVASGMDKALGLVRLPLDKLLAASDVVSIHAPLTPATTRLAGKDFFAKLKRGALFINTARGGIVDLGALYAAMKNGTVRAAGLDVLDREPPDWKEPLLAEWKSGKGDMRQRLILTPHSASFSRAAFDEMQERAAHTVRAILSGKPPINCVNEAFLPRIKR